MSAGFDNKINPGLNKPQEPKITQANSAEPMSLAKLGVLPGQDLSATKTAAKTETSIASGPVRTPAGVGWTPWAMFAPSKNESAINSEKIVTPNTDECIKLAKACLG
jgi:hypothetical protein